MKRIIYVTAAIVVISYACQRQVSNPGIDAGNNAAAADSLAQEAILDAQAPTVCFEGEVLPIFQTNCAKSGCHDATSHKEGYIFDTYQHIVSKGIIPYHPHESEVYNVIAEGEMPPRGYPKLTSDQQTLIRRWIRQGAKNTKNCTACDVTQYTYSGTISVIMETNCTGCHSGSNASAGIDLSTYKGVQTVALNGRLVGSVTHSAGYAPMPLNAPMLSDCNITQIEEWVNAGAPNN